MQEKIIIEKASMPKDRKFTEFEQINFMLEDGWIVKDFKFDISSKPPVYTIIAVLQKVD